VKLLTLSIMMLICKIVAKAFCYQELACVCATIFATSDALLSILWRVHKVRGLELGWPVSETLRREEIDGCVRVQFATVS